MSEAEVRTDRGDTVLVSSAESERLGCRVSGRLGGGWKLRDLVFRRFGGGWEVSGFARGTGCRGGID